MSSLAHNCLDPPPHLDMDALRTENPEIWQPGGTKNYNLGFGGVPGQVTGPNSGPGGMACMGSAASSGGMNLAQSGRSGKDERARRGGGGNDDFRRAESMRAGGVGGRSRGVMGSRAGGRSGRGALPPPPEDKLGRAPGRGGGGAAPRRRGPVLHKTDNRWQGGKVITEESEEEKRQKAFKGILNKLTIDNFAKLSEKLLEVGIEEEKTLMGLVDQIFDKALTETSFCEMCAQLCQTIHPKLPTFDSQDPGDKRVDFRRLLLNMCQQEFENGSAAMQAVCAREVREKAKEAGGKAGAAAAASEEAAAAHAAADAKAVDKADEKEDHEITDEQIAIKAQEKADADEECQARKRMLGNMQFIGELFRYGLLTEKIMHSCIQTLLPDESDPHAEDLEALCMLLTTIGMALDNSKKPEYRKAMNVYFGRMDRCGNHPQLESGIRYMVQDVLDMRASKWVPRQSAEGPKQSRDVHREAAQQLAQQAQRDRDERGRDRGSNCNNYSRDQPAARPPSTFQDRMLSRDNVSTRTVAAQRNGSQEVSLQPCSASGFGKSRSAGAPAPPLPVSEHQLLSLNKPSAKPAAVAVMPLAAAAATELPTRASASGSSRPSASAGGGSLSPKEVTARCRGLVEEYHVHHNAAELLASLGELRTKGGAGVMAHTVDAVVRAALEIRGIDVDKRMEPVKKIISAALASPEGVLTQLDLEAGVVRLLGGLHQLADDMPKAPGLLGPWLASFVVADKLSLATLCSAVLDVEPKEEGADPPLVDADLALPFLLGVLSTLAVAQGEEAAAAAWRAVGVPLASFASGMSPERDDADKLRAAATKGGAAFAAA